MFRFLRIPVLAAAIVGAVNGVSFAQSVYHRGNGGDPETLDPHKVSINTEFNIINDLYEGLVTNDAAGKIIPGVAESWDISLDGKVYTFHFRKDARWSNGKPVTAGDFVFSFRRIMTPATGSDYAQYLYSVHNGEGVHTGKLDPSKLAIKALDDRTLEIRLDYPVPHFINILNTGAGLPVYPPSVEKDGDDFVKPGVMVSNGAYVLEDFVPNAQTAVVRNPYFHDADTVAIDTVIFYPTEDKSAALRRFAAGELDSDYEAPLEEMDWMREHLGDRLHMAPNLAVYYYVFNSGKAPFNDRRVRRALSMVIDRTFLAEEIWKGAMTPGYGAVPPGLSDYGEPEALDFKGQSIIDREDEALKLMREAGYAPDNPLKISLRYNTNVNHKNTAVAIADMWKPLGVETNLVNSDVATHYGLLKRGEDFDIARAGWVGDTYAESFLHIMESGGAFNYSKYSNPQFDALMEKARTTDGARQERTLLHQAEQILLSEQPNLYLFYYNSINLVSEHLKGWVDNPPDVHLSRWMSLER